MKTSSQVLSFTGDPLLQVLIQDAIIKWQKPASASTSLKQLEVMPESLEQSERAGLLEAVHPGGTA